MNFATEKNAAGSRRDKYLDYPAARITDKDTERQNT